MLCQIWSYISTQMSDSNFNSLQLLAMARCGIDPKDLESLNYADFQSVYVDD